VTATREGATHAHAGTPATEKRGMNLTLRIWRQKDPTVKGKIVTYKVTDISPDMSFLEMLDVLNEQLILQGDDPVAFDHDCREGICGMCGVMINGQAHGPQQTTTCQLHMRSFNDGDTIVVEPWRASPFPVIKDLAVPTGTAPEAHSTPVPKKDSDAAFDAATCIGCGACVAACPNASSMLFTAAKVAHLGLLPQGQPERDDRVVNMVHQQDLEGFGGCTNIGECSASCPKGISMETISRLNHDLLGALRAGVRPKS
jgi:succinate dehydrogenase / fumarate reductase iron-sulfur subunit